MVPAIAGIPVIMSNHADVSALYKNFTTGDANEGKTSDNAPLANTAGSGRTTHYDLPTAAVDGRDMVAEASLIKGFVFTPEAVATVKLLDLGMESEYQIQRQGTLFVAKYSMGHGALRPGRSDRQMRSGAQLATIRAGQRPRCGAAVPQSPGLPHT